MNFYECNIWLHNSNTALLIMAVDRKEAEEKVMKNLRKKSESDTRLLSYLDNTVEYSKTEFSINLRFNPIDLNKSNGIFPIRHYDSEWEI